MVSLLCRDGKYLRRIVVYTYRQTDRQCEKDVQLQVILARVDGLLPTLSEQLLGTDWSPSAAYQCCRSRANPRLVSPSTIFNHPADGSSHSINNSAPSDQFWCHTALSPGHEMHLPLGSSLGQSANEPER